MKRYLYALLARYIRYFLPPGARVVEVSPASPLLRDHLAPRDITFFDPHADGPPDESWARLASLEPERIILNGCLHYERNIQDLLERLRGASPPSARLVITYYSSVWKPLFRLASRLGLSTKGPERNWLAPSDVLNLLRLAGWQAVSESPRVLLPVRVPVLSDLVNRWLAPIPPFSWFAMVRIVVAEPTLVASADRPSVSVVIPARNERGNIESAIMRTPAMGPDDELIFVEGHSADGTWEEIEAAAARHPERRIVCLRQTGRGKGDAVRAGFAAARHEVLMILDADLTVPPEELPRFYRALTGGVGDLINGSRLVYPMEQRAMRFANMVGNKFFAAAFSFLLGQPLKDTLCGTKVLRRSAYEAIARDRLYFGDFDPFGDFDLLFGASRQAMRIVELPIRYQERTYGDTNIRRWTHGWLLLRMTVFAARRIKFL
ncbi:MAG: glycosyltransferase family 2 protein [Vicinamibacterales bacterium]